MKMIFILLIGLFAASCAHDPSCEQACIALRAVKPDKEGYLPRDKILQAVGLSDSDFNTFARTYYGGYAHLDCGCFFEFAVRDHPSPSTMTRKTIDEILNNPNRIVSATPAQLESAVIVWKHQEICRVESEARTRKKTWLSANNEVFAK